MARTTTSRRSAARPQRLAKASSSYNIEKQPLRTGIMNNPNGLRHRMESALGDWSSRRRMAGWVALILIAMTIGLGVTLTGLAQRVFGKYFGIE